MLIAWVESANLEAGAGHGVDFFAGEEPTGDDLVAVLRGFEWLHGSPESVEIAIRPPDDEYDGAFLANARASIEHWVNHPEMLRAHARPSPELLAVVNG